jgi:hypothetical protein
LPPSHVVVACGALGYRCAEPDFHFHMIRRMWAVCTETLIVNLLDAATFPAHPLLVGRDVAPAVALAQALAPTVEVVRGYLDDDVTLVLRRAGP